MTFSICVGTYQLAAFAELNIRSLRTVFGSAPILVYDGCSPESPKIKVLADRFDCSYVSEKINRHHFAGDIQSAVCAIAFAQANDCDIFVKLNQRFILLSPEIPDRLEEIFSNPKINLAMPMAPQAETIHDAKSKFHAKFQQNPCCIVGSAKAFDAQHIADAYAEQVRTSQNRSETLTEYFWAKMVQNEFKDRWQAIPWLSEPTEPPEYLQKCQHTSEQYEKAAISLGMPPTQFDVSEWSQISKSGYQPLPRAV